MCHHLAQVNVARMLEPLDSPRLAPFAARLDAVNVEADRAPGFVWRLRDATSVRDNADPLTLFNLSVWESVEALKQYTYSAGHVEAFRARGEWFERPADAHLAIWWIPVGHIPTIDEAVERLDYRRSHGDTEVAFSFSRPFPAPEAPQAATVPGSIDLDGRTFATACNTDNGDADGATRFEYRQQGGRIWAIYRGGKVRFGSLVAAARPGGRLDMRYHHVGADDCIRTGLCVSTPELLPDGRVRLVEEWQWTNGDHSRGRSILEEVAPGKI
jgi:heme-degrading monooxygenase HmoA